MLDDFTNQKQTGSQKQTGFCASLYPDMQIYKIIEGLDKTECRSMIFSYAMENFNMKLNRSQYFFWVERISC